ncbi:hypothetical protein L1887_34664 [Cichorium endivia]|nr:hypothetical protein L1887_34664 [Cichorium endivia]
MNVFKKLTWQHSPLPIFTSQPSLFQVATIAASRSFPLTPQHPSDRPSDIKKGTKLYLVGNVDQPINCLGAIVKSSMRRPFPEGMNSTVKSLSWPSFLVSGILRLLVGSPAYAICFTLESDAHYPNMQISAAKKYFKSKEMELKA